MKNHYISKIKFSELALSYNFINLMCSLIRKGCIFMSDSAYNLLQCVVCSKHSTKIQSRTDMLLKKEEVF